MSSDIVALALKKFLMNDEFRFIILVLLSMSNVFIRNMFWVSRATKKGTSDEFLAHMANILWQFWGRAGRSSSPTTSSSLDSSSSSTWRVQRWRSKRRTNWTQNEGEISTTVCFSAFFPGTRFNFTLFQHCREEESHGKRDMWRGSDPKRRLLQTSWLWQLFTANPQRHFGWTGELNLYNNKINWLSKLNNLFLAGLWYLRGASRRQYHSHSRQSSSGLERCRWRHGHMVAITPHFQWSQIQQSHLGYWSPAGKTKRLKGILFCTGKSWLSAVFHALVY